ncbi:MAG: NADPH-dependent FMN reductase, partial [Pseudomonadota bacterium]
RVEGNPWLHKPVAIMSATAGRAGGARGSYALRLAMLPFRPRMVAGPDIGVAGAAKEFDANGQLTGELYLKNLGELMDQVKAEAAR